jgi:hypothetical protein
MTIVALVYVMARIEREKQKTKKIQKKILVSGDTVVSSIKKI